MSTNERKTKVGRRPRSVDGVVRAKAKKPTSPTPIGDSTATTTAPPPKHRRVWLRRGLWVAVPLVGVTSAVWAVGNLYGMHYAIHGANMSVRASRSVVEQQITGSVASYRLRIVDPDGATKSYSFKDMGVRPDIPATVTSLQNRSHSWSARLQWWKPITLRLRLQTDTLGLQKFITEHVSRTVEPAKDAAITVENGEVKLAPGSSGKAYGLTNPTSGVLLAAERLQTTPLRMHEVKVPPAIIASQLSKVRAALEHTLHQKVVIEVGGENTTPQARDIAAWLKLIPDATKKTVLVESNKEAIQTYLDNVAAERFEPPKAQLTNGSATIPGVAGTRVTDTQSAAATITDKLLAAQGVEVHLPVQHTPFRTVSAPLAGRWIVVDTTTKRMYAYQGVNLVKSFLVSAGAPGTPTPVGHYAVYSKYARQTMTGNNVDGSRYVQPNVPWVSYFYRDFAIHGNYWRPASYFGAINSSHGCVGVSTADAAWVYNWAVAGTPVIVHT